MALIEQQENRSNDEFLDKLIHLTKLFHRKNYELASVLGVTPNRLSQLLRGEKPSDTLAILVNRIHKESLATEKIQDILFSQNTEALLTEWVDELEIPRQQFIEQCLMRFGQQTRDLLLRLRTTRILGNSGQPLSSPVERALKQTEVASREIVAEERARRESSPSRGAHETNVHKSERGQGKQTHRGHQRSTQDEVRGSRAGDKGEKTHRNK